MNENRIETAEQEMMDRVREQAAEAVHKTQDLVEKNPGTAVVVAFGVGLAVGWALMTSLTSPAPSWAEKHVPDWLDHLARQLPEKFHQYVS